MSVRPVMNVRGGSGLHGAIVLAVTALAVLALLPAGAYARGRHPGGTVVKRTPSATVYAPPGKAGATEYFEVVPNSGGGVAPPANLSSPGSANLKQLGQGGQTAHALSKLGATGTYAANWARATAPVRLGGTPSGGLTSHLAGASASGGGSALAGVLQVLGGSDVDGLGAVLPLALILLLVGAVGFVLGRRLRPRRA